ncbi:hypothetical protein OG978_22235 [Streptomyces sp. NBC_01591]|uniref:hypothetical protein n=1 Tax=Streptomyces sp. NBC_01591 TaxID=2975888 RepID=UPI002DD96581|nr:hypothetical protein [Streptomyces sp. NBC_01591]WSD69853.1 hypothetical protein OG978_22235 [Streptomyces sp. NBC_01591]
MAPEPTPVAGVFPPHPIRDVQATYARQAGCPSDFAQVVADFEPWEEGVEFEVVGTASVKGRPAEEIASFHEGFIEGVREELAALAEREPATAVAVAVVLRRIKVHEADSHRGAFLAAGRVAVRNALVQAYGPPPRPKRRRGSAER